MTHCATTLLAVLSDARSQISYLNITDFLLQAEGPVGRDPSAVGHVLALLAVPAGHGQGLVLEAVEAVGRVGRDEAVRPHHEVEGAGQQEPGQKSDDQSCSRAGHFRYFLIFSQMKNYIFIFIKLI